MRLTSILITRNAYRSGGVSIVPLSNGCIALPTVGITVYHQSQIAIAMEQIRKITELPSHLAERILTHPAIVELPRE